MFAFFMGIPLPPNGREGLGTVNACSFFSHG